MKTLSEKFDKLYKLQKYIKTKKIYNVYYEDYCCPSSFYNWFD